MPVFYAYVAIVALQAVAAHANTRIGFGLLKYLVVTPQYHHWHHADDPKYYNKNFAIHLPIIDRVLVPTTFQAWKVVGTKTRSMMGKWMAKFLL